MANHKLPNLLYIGADKAGSTSICAILDDHPEVHVTPAKDTYYFTTEHRRGLQWYERQFSPQSSDRVIAEVCHDYLYDRESPGRIRAELGGDVRVLVCLRDPIDRAVSSWMHRRKHGYTGSFDEAAAAFPDILDHGDYGTHLARWFDVFEQKQIVVTVFDDLVADAAGFAASLYDRLDLTPHAASHEALEPRLTAASPRSGAVAAVAKHAAIAVRHLGGAKMVGRAKGNPAVQRLLYRQIQREPEATTLGIAELERRFGPEVACASRLTGIDLVSAWPRYRAALGSEPLADPGASRAN